MSSVVELVLIDELSQHQFHVIVVLDCSHNAIANILRINVMFFIVVYVDKKQLVFQKRYETFPALGFEININASKVVE